MGLYVGVVISLHAHYFQGRKSTQDEKGVAAKKAVELDDSLAGAAEQVWLLLCYFIKFLYWYRGVKHVVQNGEVHVGQSGVKQKSGVNWGFKKLGKMGSTWGKVGAIIL